MSGVVRRKKKNLILIGFMGSGKTTVGVKLSYRLRMPVEDTDKMIEKRCGMSISEIFADKGEEAFRAMETGILREIAAQDFGHIYSVGGGTPVREENRPLLRACGTVVYLRAKPETIYERLRGDTTRPLLQCADPLTRIRTLMAERSAAYEECADLIVDVDALGTEDAPERIVRALREEAARGNPQEDRKEDRREERKQQVQSAQQEKERAYQGMKLLVINGPNLNFLGIREKGIYGTQDYQYLLDLIAKKAEESGSEILVFQSNHEGAIIDRIQEAYFDGTEGIVINPGAYTHYSYAIRDALASITVPKVEIHISDITKREEFRRISVTKEACDHQIYGKGLDGYLEAVDYILELSRKN